MLRMSVLALLVFASGCIVYSPDMSGDYYNDTDEFAVLGRGNLYTNDGAKHTGYWSLSYGFYYRHATNSVSSQRVWKCHESDIIRFSPALK